MSGVQDEVVIALYTSGVDAVRAVADPFDESAWSELTCGEWSATETARHLVAVVEWYHEWLDRAVAGDASVPFGEDEFDHRNRVGIERHGDLDGPAAVDLFATQAAAYLERAVNEWDRPFGYPGGTVTVGLHCAIAAIEWHLHAWDLSAARGTCHEPTDPGRLMVAAANAIAHTERGIHKRMIRLAAPILAKRQPWKRLLDESGRNATQTRPLTQ